jgi:plasmid stabilization system protein ParE
MKVYWTAEARFRLLDIQAYIAKNSPEAARRTVARLLLRSHELESEPLVSRRLPEFPDEPLREVLERPFRLIFRVTQDRIEIITVKHYRQKLPASPRGLSGS